MKITDSKYIEQYTLLHEKKKYGASSELYYSWIKSEIEILKPKTILDYGCGQSKLSNLIANDYIHIDVSKYDPSIPTFNNLIVKKYDLILCTDVLEHLTYDILDNILITIKLMTENVIFVVNTQKAKNILPNGENAHTIIQNKEWWLLKLQTNFPNIKELNIKNKKILQGSVAFKSF